MPLLSSDSARYCVLPARNRPATSQIFLYFGSLTLLIYLATPSGNLVDIATSYMLKNRLHATASQVSMLRLLTGIPAYIALVFGLARDLWSPFGLRDRGYFLCFAPIAAVSFLGMAFYHLSYSGLFLGSLFVTLSLPLHCRGVSSAACPHRSREADDGPPHHSLAGGFIYPHGRFRLHIRMGRCTSSAKANVFADGGAGFGHRLPRVLEAGLRFSRHL